MSSPSPRPTSPANDLTDLEKLILERSRDLHSTTRRLRVSIVSSLATAVAFVYIGFRTESWKLLLAATLLHLFGVTWERVMYANAVRLYKTLVAKLAAERGHESFPQVG